MINDEGIGVYVIEFAGEEDGEYEVDLAEDGAEDGEAGEDRGGDDGVAADSNIERTYMNYIRICLYKLLG